MTPCHRPHALFRFCVRPTHLDYLASTESAYDKADFRTEMLLTAPAVASLAERPGEASTYPTTVTMNPLRS